MLAEITRDKNQKLNGKDIMCFEDFQYSKINEYILDLPEKKEENIMDTKQKLETQSYGTEN